MPLPSTRFRALRSYEADPHYANSQYGELLVSERTPIISVNPSFPVSSLRNKVTSVASASVVKVTAEYRLTLTASGTDAVTVDTAQRGLYTPGYSAQVGLGVRIPVAPTGNQKAVWGYMDDNDGIYFGLDAQGYFVARLKDGVEQVWRQADWSADKLDGTGASGYTLNHMHGNIYHIDFSWYGYGTIEWKVCTVDEYGRQQTVTAHRFTPEESLSISQPNLPIRIKASNGGTATAWNVFLAGRQFSVKGRYRPVERVSCHRVLGKSVAGTLVPVMSFRTKSSSPPAGIALDGFDVIASGDVLITVQANASLGGTPSFGNLADVPVDETVLEVDTAASSVSGGQMIYSALVSADASVGRISLRRDGEPVHIPSDGNITIAAQALSGTYTVNIVMRMLESW